MRFLIPVAALALLAAPAFAQQKAGAAPMADMPGMSGSSAQAPTNQAPSDKAMMDGMAKMNRDMAAAPMTGDADRDFVAMMIPHHQGAVDMARVELQYGHDPKLRKLARSIVAAQQKEIAEMKAWQARHPAH